MVLAATAATVPSQDPAEGARELVYRFEIEQAIARGELDAKTDTDAVMGQMLGLLQARLEGIAAEIEVARRGDCDVVVAIPPGAAAALPEIRRLIETPAARLELRMLASAEDSPDGVRFDLAGERHRLERWLEQDDHRAQVAKNPHHIDAFNALRTADGGRLQTKLRWYPRKVFPDAKDPTQWSYSYTRGRGVCVVPAFTAEQLAKRPPEEADGRPFLVELFPIDMHEEHFGGKDMDGDKVRAGTDPNTGMPCVFYEITAGRKSAYADFSKLLVRAGGRMQRI